MSAFAEAVSEELIEELARREESMSSRDRRRQAAGIARARDTGMIEPWQEFSRGPGGTCTLGRDMLGTNCCALIVVGRAGSLAWAVSGPSDSPNLIMAAGVVRDTNRDPFALAMRLADEALHRINPDEPSTYTARLSEDDYVMLMNRDLITEDTVL